eukprot:8872502-Lingulodinium_polyedra.AAC.1
MADHARQWAHWHCHRTLRVGPSRDYRHGAVLPPVAQRTEPALRPACPGGPHHRDIATLGVHPGDPMRCA